MFKIYTNNHSTHIPLIPFLLFCSVISLYSKIKTDLFNDPPPTNNDNNNTLNINNINITTTSELPSSYNHNITPSDDNGSIGDIRDMPPIRDNPEMAQTTARRRSSVANPISIKYSDPGLSVDDSTDDNSDDDEEEDMDGYDGSATNELQADDPSISDLNESVES